MSSVSLPSLPALRLRGHHLLCVFGFRGYGYDEDFIAGMSAIVRRLLLPDVWVEIVAGADDICARCPRRDRAHCATTEHPRDVAVLNELGLATGSRVASTELVATVVARLQTSQLAQLCAGCPWYALGYCMEGVASGQIGTGWSR